MSNVCFVVIGFDCLTDINVAIMALGREAAEDEFSTHVPAVNPYDSNTFEHKLWSKGYRQRSDEIMVQMDDDFPFASSDFSPEQGEELLSAVC